MTAVNPVKLRSLWIREIMGWWVHYNWLYLSSAMRAPSVALSESSQVMGRWWSERRLLEVSSVHILRDPWSSVMDTLRHEMAHQFVHEVLDVQDEPPHGPAFREACRRLRVDPGACARGEAADLPRPEARVLNSEQESSLHEKIHKLLSLATSPNEHEAQAAMNKARQLLLKYNLEMKEVAEGPGRYARRRIGELKVRRQTWEYILSGILAKFFFVHVLWVDDYDARSGKKGRVQELSGTGFNLDMAEYVHGYLSQLLPRLWEDYRRRRGLRSHRDRRTYYSGVLTGFMEQLEGQEQRLRQEKALIWVGDGDLDAFVNYHHPRTSSRRAGSISASDAYWEGVKDGKKVRLSKPLRSGGASGRRLGPG